jgi:hypothetical protein
MVDVTDNVSPEREPNRLPESPTDMRSRYLVIAVFVCLTASCGLTATSTPAVDYPVSGTVTAGPTCPVQQDAGPECDDHPVQGAVLFVRDAKGDVYGEITVGPDGRFNTRLPAGTYVLEPQAVDGIMGTASPVDFEVGPELTVDLEISYDTGIR